MKKIHLIRHGQTDFNKSGIVQGSGVNSSLNETGVNQANAFFEHYKTEPYEIIYTSDLNRSIESVQNFIDLSIPWKRREGLNEISWGDYDGKKITNDDYYWGVVERWHNGEVKLRPINGESPQDTLNRIIPVIDEIIESEENNILICMHGRAMRILLTYLEGVELKNMDAFPHHNLGLYVILYDKGKFSIETTNETTHLKELS